ncbi:hypothetical protein PG989_010466 [Apiospora arundinis]
MAYSDTGDSVRKTAGTIATVWIIVIVVLVVLSVAGCIVAVWMWRRHVRRRRQRMDAFYATPIQNGPQQQQYPNYSYQQVQPKQEQQQRPQHPVSEIYTPNSPQPPPPVAQLDGQHTEVGSISHRSSYSPLPAQLDAQPTGVSSNGSNHNNHPTNNHNTNTSNNHNNMNNQPPSELP